MDSDERAIHLGHPSYVWREGQERRLQLVRRYVRLEGARILDVGCGLGLYARRFLDFTRDVHGVDVDPDKAREASWMLPNVQVASAEHLPYADGLFDLVLLHEVVEHLEDDLAAVREAYRVLAPGGRLVIFAPNRLYPFETHGIYWGGNYHFGNFPLVNYLPGNLRARFCPHVRAYTCRDLRCLLADLPGRVLVHRRIFAGYDSIMAHRPALGRLLRRVTHALEGTPLEALGLSHFLVFEKVALHA